MAAWSTALKDQAGLSQMAVSWNTAPPAGKPGSAEVSTIDADPFLERRHWAKCFRPRPCRATRRRRLWHARPASLCSLPKRTRAPSAACRSLGEGPPDGSSPSGVAFAFLTEPGVSVNVEFRNAARGCRHKPEGFVRRRRRRNSSSASGNDGHFRFQAGPSFAQSASKWNLPVVMARSRRGNCRALETGKDAIIPAPGMDFVGRWIARRL